MRSLRILLRLALSAVLLAVLAGSLGGLGWRLSLMEHARPYLALGAVGLGLAALLLRQRLSAALACAGGIAAAVPVVLALYDAPGPGGGRIVSVLTANLLYSNASTEALAEALNGSGADILLLQEVSPLHEPLLGQLAASFPYREPAQPEGSRGDLVLSRLPLESAEAIYRDRWATLWRVPVEVVPGLPVTLLTGHPLPPLSNERLEAQARWLAAARDAAARETAPVILGGDFNATPWSRALGELRAKSEFRYAAGWAALSPSFPAFWPSWFGVSIDHVLVTRGVGAGESRHLELPGSDHRGLLVELIFADPDGD